MVDVFDDSAADFERRRLLNSRLQLCQGAIEDDSAPFEAFADRLDQHQDRAGGETR